MDVTVNNKAGSSISVTASNAIVAASAATAMLTNEGTISAGVSRTVDFERADQNMHYREEYENTDKRDDQTDYADNKSVAASFAGL